MRRTSIFCATIALVACVFSAAATPPNSGNSRKIDNAAKEFLYGPIGRAWYRAMQTHIDEISVGTIRIALIAAPSGKVLSLRVLSNTSNQRFAEITLSVIKQTELLPIPAKFLSDGKFEDEISFKMFAN